MLNGVKDLLTNIYSLRIDPSLSLRMTMGEGSLTQNLLLPLQHSTINRDYLPGNVGGQV
ncbi:MAG: hypothetical protein JWR38_4538 [Mucilaginibacter sp.]|nr:hypothetical protein [Mucilaginibacter sp.]